MIFGRPDYDAMEVSGIRGEQLTDIPPDEPVFLLRGQDKVAWLAVELYAKMLVLAGGDPVICMQALEHAQRMRLWPAKKVPNLSEEAPFGRDPSGKPWTREVAAGDGG